jgi:hypothetical protein
MLFSVNPDISLPHWPYLPHCWAQGNVKKEHISIPSIPGPQSRFDIDNAGMFATNIGYDVPNLAPVIHKGSSHLRRSCHHFLIHSLIIFCRIFSFRFDRNVWVNNIIQCSPSYTILRGKVLFDLLQGPWPILVIYLRFFCNFLETNFMMLLVSIAANQNQVDCIGNRLTLNPFHMFQIIYIKLQVSHCPDGYRYPIVA